MSDPMQHPPLADALAELDEETIDEAQAMAAARVAYMVGYEEGVRDRPDAPRSGAKEVEA